MAGEGAQAASAAAKAAKAAAEKAAAAKAETERETKRLQEAAAQAAQAAAARAAAAKAETERETKRLGDLAAQAAAAQAARAAAAQAETERETKRLQQAAQTPPRSDGVQAAQDAAAAAKKLAEEVAKLAAAGPNFQGVGVVPYLDKNGNVPTIKTPTKPGGGNNTFIPDETGLIITNPAMPETPEPTPTNTSDGETAVRIAKRNVTDISSLVPQFDAEQIQKLLFENISAIELSIIERHDTIEGINQRYSIISNLSEVRKKYDAGKQLSPMDKFKPLTSIYTINIEDKIPQEDYIKDEGLESSYQYLDENNQLVTRQKGYYYIDTNGDLVIELINLEKNQQVEVYIDTNGTIYKVES
jgi:hypothetical protein